MPADIAGGDLEQATMSCCSASAPMPRGRTCAPTTAASSITCRNGGVVIVQYNTPEFDQNYGPYPYTMGRNPEEVTDEFSKVNILNPAHPDLQLAEPYYRKRFRGLGGRTRLEVDARVGPAIRAPARDVMTKARSRSAAACSTQNTAKASIFITPGPSTASSRRSARRIPPLRQHSEPGQGAPLSAIPDERLRLSGEVRDALAGGRPVVALETTIVTHGMPYPENVATARSVEQWIRSQGRDARHHRRDRRDHPHWTRRGRTRMARSARDILKLSRNDLPYALAAGRQGATTVAATMICAHRAGIRVFATGGIGGVHRGAETSFDISADLEELARTPVAVVCAGAKALLDLPKTLEYLETRGVPVVGYRTDEFPAFWSRSSGLPVPIRLDSAGRDRAAVAVSPDSGAVVCNPVDPADEIPAAEMSACIDDAVVGDRRPRHHRQGRHPAHPRPRRRDDRRAQPPHQHRAGAIQRAAGRRNRQAFLTVRPLHVGNLCGIVCVTDLG